MIANPEPAVTMDGLTREEWIAARMSEFQTDPLARDRAMAMILHDELYLGGQLQQVMALIQKEGMGGLLKMAMLGGNRNGKS